MPVIAVDVDEVIAAHAEAFIEFSNNRWGTNLKVTDYDEHWANMWRIERQELEKRAQAFFREFPDFKHFPDATDVLTRLKKKYELIILTSRRKELAKETERWVAKYYPNIFSKIHYSGIWDDTKEDPETRSRATKGALLNGIGADYLIDDQPKHCFSAAELGLEALLFGDYHWNNNLKELPKGVTRVKSWLEVGNYFDAKS